MTKRDIGQEILDSIKTMKAGEQGRMFVVTKPEQIREARERMTLSQSKFSAIRGGAVRTLQEWEQGRRRPNKSAQSLLTIAARRPDVMRELFLAA